jgi:ABC-2 type transport system permease protein
MMAIAKASFRAILKSPSAVVFGIGFPLIFIFVFGMLGSKSGPPKSKIALSATCDTNNVLYKTIMATNSFSVSEKTQKEIGDDLKKGRIAGIIDIQKSKDTNSVNQFLIHINTTQASADQIPSLEFNLRKSIGILDAMTYPNNASVAKIAPIIPEKIEHEYNYIDFILPGMLGFSLLSSAIFGVAFVFFNMRQTMVLKRYFATPISKPYIILGEAISRVGFQLISSVIVIAVGYFFFEFHLINGWSTFFEILVLSIYAFITFMGFGFLISGLAKSESTIPPLSNLITLPQFLMAGTFFSTTNFPKWLQPIANALPLAQFNNAMRKISFEGAHLWDTWKELGILAIWGIIIYALAAKFFKWE